MYRSTNSKEADSCDERKGYEKTAVTLSYMKSMSIQAVYLNIKGEK